MRPKIRCDGYCTKKIDLWGSKALFGSKKNLQNFLDFPSYRIFGHMHQALNIDKK
jgi:hypothetical protein